MQRREQLGAALDETMRWSDGTQGQRAAASMRQRDFALSHVATSAANAGSPAATKG